MRLVPAAASYTGLLGVLAIAMIVPNFVGLGQGFVLAIEMVAVVVMIGSLWRVEPRRWVVALAVISAVVVSVAAIGLRSGNVPEMPWIVVKHVSGDFFIGVLLVTILRNVWTTQTVRADTIVGGIVVYVLIGVFFAGLYQLLEYVQPGSFVADHSAGIWQAWEVAPGEYPRLFFFSFVTLTTLGYGDISPGSVPAASLATIESVGGSLYLTILIARLVGLHIAATRDSAPES